MNHNSLRWMVGLGALSLLGFGTAQAVSVNLHPSNVGISSISVNVVDETITIDETWTSTGTGAILFDDLDDSVDFTVIKNITNNTGVDWTRLANELLDPSGQTNDNQDPAVQPSFVPLGFSTSNDTDGLSFAQGSGLPRTSTVFPNVFVDEETDARDFLDFFGGTLANGGIATVTFGLRDNDGDNQPFILAQRPNESSRPGGGPSNPVPEPSTFILLGSGLVGLAAWRVRKGNRKLH